MISRWISESYPISDGYPVAESFPISVENRLNLGYGAPSSTTSYVSQMPTIVFASPKAESEVSKVKCTVAVNYTFVSVLC